MWTGIFFRFAGGAVFLAVTLLNCESGFAQESYSSLLQSKASRSVFSVDGTESTDVSSLNFFSNIGAWPPQNRDAGPIHQSVLPVAFMQQSQSPTGTGGVGGEGGINSGGTGGGGAGAAAATDPSGADLKAPILNWLHHR